MCIHRIVYAFDFHFDENDRTKIEKNQTPGEEIGFEQTFNCVAQEEDSKENGENFVIRKYGYELGLQKAEKRIPIFFVNKTNYNFNNGVSHGNEIFWKKFVHYTI